MFQPAQRKKTKLRLPLIGPSGSGKTYSTLFIAQELDRKVALLDNERGNASLYADLCQYDVSELAPPPFTLEKYVQAIRHASQAGYDVLILDSLTRAWTGEGDILDFMDKASKKMRNNFAACHDANPNHTTLVDSMHGAPMLIIATIRSKIAWNVVKDERTGKTKPVKFGLAPVQLDGLEYKFTTVLELFVDGHVATATKDRTGLFNGNYFTHGKDTSEKLIAWLTGKLAVREVDGDTKSPLDPQAVGKAPVIPTPKPQSVQTRWGTTVNDLYDVLMELGLANQSEKYEQYLVRKYGHGSNELNAEEITEQFVDISRCKRDKEKLKQLLDYLALVENYKKTT